MSAPKRSAADLCRGWSTAISSGCAPAPAELAVLGDAAAFAARVPAAPPPEAFGTGRELFALMRHHADNAEHGASAMLAAAGL